MQGAASSAAVRACVFDANSRLAVFGMLPLVATGPVAGEFWGGAAELLHGERAPLSVSCTATCCSGVGPAAVRRALPALPGLRCCAGKAQGSPQLGVRYTSPNLSCGIITGLQAQHTALHSCWAVRALCDAGGFASVAAVVECSISSAHSTSQQRQGRQRPCCYMQRGMEQRQPASRAPAQLPYPPPALLPSPTLQVGRLGGLLLGVQTAPGGLPLGSLFSGLTAGPADRAAALGGAADACREAASYAVAYQPEGQSAYGALAGWACSWRWVW